MSVKNTFHKQERLCSKTQMQTLFNQGKSQLAYPIKLVYLTTQSERKFPAQSMFVVPKKSFKKAHDRNKLKRRMREAFRLNKNEFYQKLQHESKLLNLAFIFISKKPESYQSIEKATKALLLKVGG